MNELQYKPIKAKKYIDLEQINTMCSIGCSMQEVAALIGCSVQWLENERDQNPAMAVAIEQGFAQMKQGLRRAQLTMALNGSPAMLIWLGKQYLGQSDKQQVDNNTQINITVTRAMDELRNIPRDQLLAAQALLSTPAPGGGEALAIEGESVEIKEGGPPGEK